MKSTDKVIWRGLGAGFLCAVLAGPVAAEEAVCSFAQSIIAGTDLVPEVVVYNDWEAFVESKPFDQPFTIQQFASAPLESHPAINTVVSCKMRTSERINNAHGSMQQPVAGPESSCDEVHRQLLAATLARIPPAELRVPADRWVVEAEDTTYIGPRWLEPWPFVPVTREDDGILHLHTRALYSPHSWWMPMPERFLGNYYCHLADPDYIRGLATGEVDPP